MAEIGRRTTSIADLGPRSAAMSGVGRPNCAGTFGKPKSSRLHMDANSSHAASFQMDHSTETGRV